MPVTGCPFKEKERGMTNLESVGTGIDTDGMTYAMYENGGYDYANARHVSDIEPDGDWMNTLSTKDREVVRRIKMEVMLLADGGKYKTLETTLCFECGADTRHEGYVNRVPWGRDQINGYKCGPCSDTYDALTEGGTEWWDEDKWDEYLETRVAYVDDIFPDAHRFRALVYTEGSWTHEDILKVGALLSSYRKV